jgi:hypothetical protein
MQLSPCLDIPISPGQLLAGRTTIDVFARVVDELAAWCAGRPDLASMRAGASCLFISMSELFAVLAASPAKPTVRPA